MPRMGPPPTKRRQRADSANPMAYVKYSVKPSLLTRSGRSLATETTLCNIAPRKKPPACTRNELRTLRIAAGWPKGSALPPLHMLRILTLPIFPAASQVCDGVDGLYLEKATILIYRKIYISRQWQPPADSDLCQSIYIISKTRRNTGSEWLPRPMGVLGGLGA